MIYKSKPFFKFQFNFDILPGNLQTLNLHKNYITDLSPSTNPLKLVYLELSGNNIQHLPLEVFANLWDLKLLTLSNNMLTTLEFYPLMPQSLTKLDLRSNLIKSLKLKPNNLVNFKDLINMKELYLSQNLWECSCNWKSNVM